MASRARGTAAAKNGWRASHSAVTRHADGVSPYSDWKCSAAAASMSDKRVAPCGGVTCHRRVNSSASTMLTGQPASACLSISLNISRSARPMQSNSGSSAGENACSASSVTGSPLQRLTRSRLTAWPDTPSRSDCPSALRMQGHPFDFGQRGAAALDQLQRGQAQAARAVVVGGLLDLADRPLVDDQFADLVVQREDFGDRAAALVAGAAAVAAALPLHELEVVDIGAGQADA